MEIVKSVEFPKKFKSWYQFWQELKKNGLDSQTKIFYAEPDGLQIIKIEYYVSDIKECLLDELLNHQGKCQEFTFDEMRQIEYALANQNKVIYPKTDIFKKVKSNLDYLYNERD